MLYLAEKINNLGIECSHFSCGAGVAFEAWEKGLLGPDRTGGLKLEWGNVDAVDKLLDMATDREGWLGNLLAEGPKQLAEALGGDAPNWAVHTKGGTPAMHEWRPLLGQMLRELVASGGMKPQGGGEPTGDAHARMKMAMYLAGILKSPAVQPPTKLPVGAELESIKTALSAAGMLKREAA